MGMLSGLSPDSTRAAISPVIKVSFAGSSYAPPTHPYAKQSDGHVVIDSAVGRGTTFSVYLRRHAERVGEEMELVRRPPVHDERLRLHEGPDLPRDALEHARRVKTAGVDLGRDVQRSSEALSEMLSIIAQAPRYRDDTTTEDRLREEFLEEISNIVRRNQRVIVPVLTTVCICQRSEDFSLLVHTDLETSD